MVIKTVSPNILRTLGAEAAPSVSDKPLHFLAGVLRFGENGGRRRQFDRSGVPEVQRFVEKRCEIRAFCSAIALEERIAEGLLGGGRGTVI